MEARRAVDAMLIADIAVLLSKVRTGGHVSDDDLYNAKHAVKVVQQIIKEQEVK